MVTRMVFSTSSHMNPAHPPTTSRLTLAELCSPTPTSPAMSRDRAPSTSSSGPSSPNDTRNSTGNNRVGRSSSLSEEDESVMIAVRALDDMRSRAVPPSPAGKAYQFSTCKAFSQFMRLSCCDAYGDCDTFRCL